MVTTGTVLGSKVTVIKEKWLSVLTDHKYMNYLFPQTSMKGDEVPESKHHNTKVYCGCRV
jgi:hypothetical protein